MIQHCSKTRQYWGFVSGSIRMYFMMLPVCTNCIVNMSVIYFCACLYSGLLFSDLRGIQGSPCASLLLVRFFRTLHTIKMGEEFRCFVGGLAWATTDDRLEQAFRPFGDVIQSKVISDRETGRSRGFGFITFADENAMNEAIKEMNGKELDGRNITVNQAQP